MKKFAAIFLSLLFTLSVGAVHAAESDKSADEQSANWHWDSVTDNYIPWTWDDIED
ncbi:MAG: hypothetical protein ACQETD_11370 [Pseudomonadota bacterium]